MISSAKFFGNSLFLLLLQKLLYSLPPFFFFLPTPLKKKNSPPLLSQNKNPTKKKLTATMIANKEELAVSYAALILHDEGLAITADQMTALTKAANVPVQKFWPTLFAKALEGKDIDQLLTCGGGAAAPAAGGAAPAAADAAPAEEEKKEEVKESSDEEMGMGLFGDDDDY